MTVLSFPAAALAAAATVIASAAGAQQASSPIGSGSWIISGSAGLSSSHDESSDETTTSVRLAPTGLLFVMPRLAVGGTVALSYASVSSGHTTAYGLGPSVRYYFGDQAGKLFPFVSASVMPQWLDSHRTTTVSGIPVAANGTSRFIALDGSAGLTRLVASHVGVTGEAYYTHFETKTDAGTINTTRASYDVGLRFGITVFVH